LPAEPNSCQIPLFLGREQHNNETVITSLSFSKEIPLTVLKECFDVYKLQQNYLNEKMFFLSVLGHQADLKTNPYFVIQ
jgi:hypothetical protein